MVACWERANFLGILYVTFSCAFVTFPYGDLDQGCQNVSIPDICLLPYFVSWYFSFFVQTSIEHYNTGARISHGIKLIYKSHVCHENINILPYFTQRYNINKKNNNKKKKKKKIVVKVGPL